MLLSYPPPLFHQPTLLLALRTKPVFGMCPQCLSLPIAVPNTVVSFSVTAPLLALDPDTCSRTTPLFRLFLLGKVAFTLMPLCLRSHSPLLCLSYSVVLFSITLHYTFSSTSLCLLLVCVFALRDLQANRYVSRCRAVGVLGVSEGDGLYKHY